MTYRGVYRDGYVRLEGDVDLRNGSHVEVYSVPEATDAKPPLKSSRSKPPGKHSVGEWDRIVAKANKMTKKERIATIMAGCGAWKDRPEWDGKSSAEIALELRARASRRGRHA